MNEPQPFFGKEHEMLAALCEPVSKPAECVPKPKSSK
jgi:hypothetical protein